MQTAMRNQGDNEVRARLLQCARELMASNGHEALSIRRVAERAGLSSGAPYWHFADRRALLLGIALDTFDRMNEAAEAATTGPDADPVARLRALAALFLRFSQEHPQEVDLMYESELTRPIDEALKPAYRRAFRMIVEAVTCVHPDKADARNVTRALVFWSSVFGLSRLIRHQLLEPFAGGDECGLVDAMLSEIVAVAAAG